MRRVSELQSGAKRSKIGISSFRGIDLCNSPSNVALSRSPDAPNMIRDVPGKVRKRMGYHKIAQYDGRINGVHRYVGKQGETELIHAGERLYIGENCVYEGIADVRSSGWQLGDRLYLLDGKRLLAFDGETVCAAAETAYVPTCLISRAPSGGGTVYEQLNLIGEKWKESFLSDGTSVVYQLSFDGLESEITVEQMQSAEEWITLAEGTDYSFDPVLGRVAFQKAPPVSPVDGMDNIRITARKVQPEYAARIDRCTLSVLYGVGGSADRLFVAGNPEYPNRDWYSGMSDGSYFPLSGYSILGLNSPIAGYSIISDKLAAHKAGDADGRNIILREGKMTDGKASFPIVNTLMGVGIASAHSVAYLKTEPLFFAKNGIYAITPSDTNGERYSQTRSFYINNVLEALPNKGEAVAVSYRDFYILAHGGKLYVLDSLMRSYEDGAPYSTHQYEAFLLCDIDARTIWTQDDRLRFGTNDGAIMEFYTDSHDQKSYNDEGRPITAYWDTPILSTDAFYSRKTFRYIALKLFAAAATGVRVYVKTQGVRKLLFEESGSFRFWDFGALDFSKINFSGDETPQAYGRKIKVHKVDKAQFRLENDALNEPFGLYDLALEFTVNGKIK